MVREVINGHRECVIDQLYCLCLFCHYFPYLTQPAGGFGYDFSDPTQSTHIEEAVSTVASGILAHGVTSFCPTLITQSEEAYKKILPRLKRRAGRNAATILGVHLEGPFISFEKRGAHPIPFLRSSPIDSFEQVTDVYGHLLEGVAIVTLAPEIDHKDVVISELVRRGIVVSVGHSESNLQTGERAVESGANFITHLFNAMLPFHHRDPGLVGLLTSDRIDRQIFYGILADGLHTHAAAVRIAHRANPAGLVLVTDALSALGAPPGAVMQISGQDVEVRDGAAYIAGTDILSGSMLSMDTGCRNLRRFTACSIVQAVECASLHPAQVLGISDRKGTLSFGADADFVLMDDEMNVKETWIAGRRVWAVSGDEPETN